MKKLLLLLLATAFQIGLQAQVIWCKKIIPHVWYSNASILKGFQIDNNNIYISGNYYKQCCFAYPFYFKFTNEGSITWGVVDTTNTDPLQFENSSLNIRGNKLFLGGIKYRITNLDGNTQSTENIQTHSIVFKDSTRFSSDYNDLYAHNYLGNLLWTRPLSKYGKSEIVMSSNFLYVLAGFESVGPYTLIKVTFEGELLWQLTPGYIVDFTVDHDDNIYVLINGLVQKYSSSGTVIWSKPIDYYASAIDYSSVSDRLFIGEKLVGEGSKISIRVFDPGTGIESQKISYSLPIDFDENIKRLEIKKFIEKDEFIYIAGNHHSNNTQQAYVAKLMSEKPTQLTEGISGELLNIYPNPTSGELILSLDVTAISSLLVTDILGQRINLLDSMDSPNSRELTLNMSGKPPGVYNLVILFTNGDRKFYKFILK